MKFAEIITQQQLNWLKIKSALNNERSKSQTPTNAENKTKKNKKKTKTQK